MNMLYYEGVLLLSRAAVVELVDTLDSKSDVHLDVPVQVRLAVPESNKSQQHG